MDEYSDDMDMPVDDMPMDDAPSDDMPMDDIPDDIPEEGGEELPEDSEELPEDSEELPEEGEELPEDSEELPEEGEELPEEGEELPEEGEELPEEGEELPEDSEELPEEGEELPEDSEELPEEGEELPEEGEELPEEGGELPEEGEELPEEGEELPEEGGELPEDSEELPEEDEELPEEGGELPEESEELPEESEELAEEVSELPEEDDELTEVAEPSDERDDMSEELPEEPSDENGELSPQDELMAYMSEHNYGMWDYPEYSQDSEWQRLHAAVYPDQTELPEVEENTDTIQDMEEGYATINATDIQGVDSTGDHFWEHHTNTKDDYMQIAAKLPEVQEQLAQGATVNELMENPEFRDCVQAYYDPEKMVKVEASENGYQFQDDGRHRVAAAQELGYKIPVSVVTREGNTIKLNTRGEKNNSGKYTNNGNNLKDRYNKCPVCGESSCICDKDINDTGREKLSDLEKKEYFEEAKKCYDTAREVAGWSDLKYYKAHDLEGHINKVIEKSNEAMEVMGEITNTKCDTKDVAAAALYHDTGMDGGTKYEATDGEGIRKNHSMTSAIHVLENREKIEKDGCNADQVAALALLHSKSCSGVRNMANEKQIKTAFEKLKVEVEEYNKSYPNKSIVFEPNKIDIDKFKYNAACLRIGDALGHDSSTTKTQSGDFYDIQFEPENPLVHKEWDGNFWKDEIKDSTLTFYEKGKAVQIDDSNDPKGFTRMYQFGEGNIESMHSEGNGSEEFNMVVNVKDGRAKPLCTQECILERLKELQTTDDLFKHSMTININGKYNQEVHRLYESFARENSDAYGKIIINYTGGKKDV